MRLRCGRGLPARRARASSARRMSEASSSCGAPRPARAISATSGRQSISRKLTKHGQFRTDVSARLPQLVARLLDFADLRRQRREPRLKSLPAAFEGGDLCLVGPAEHVARAIVQTVAVVLFVPSAAALDLTRRA